MVVGHYRFSCFIIVKAKSYANRGTREVKFCVKHGGNLYYQEDADEFASVGCLILHIAWNHAGGFDPLSSVCAV